jgi:hypothetical protein
VREKERKKMKYVRFAVFALILLSVSALAQQDPRQGVTTPDLDPRMIRQASRAENLRIYQIIALNETTGEVQTFQDDVAPRIDGSWVKTSIKTTVIFGFMKLPGRVSFDRSRYSVCVKAPGKDFVFYPRIRQ